MAIIDKPNLHFETKLYTGTGATQSITTEFQPDMVWIKSRSGAFNHGLWDSVRGVTKLLISNLSNAESTDVNTVTSFDSDGFTLGTSYNGSGVTYASWNFKAGGTASSNTDGSITSSVSANQDAGFSIVSYTGTGSNATVGHGLGTTPAWVLVKERGASGESWNNFHQSLGAGITIMLNLTNAQQSSSTMWNNTAPTSSVFSVGADAGSNGSSKTYIAYCFAEKKGYSKFGSYTGNGNSNGTFVYTGFKPAWVMCKISSNGDSWVVYDNKRDTFNVTEQILRPNTSGTEGTESGAKMDLLSNGFKLRGSGGGLGQTNTSGETYIYMAFAENPFVTSTGIPTTAR